MTRRPLLWLLALAAVLYGSPTPARAGAVLTIGEDTKVNLGFRLQTQFNSTEKNIDSDASDFERSDDFVVRRGRIRLGADVTRWVSMFLQTEVSDASAHAVGINMTMIDAFLKLKLHKLAHIIVGENMAPSTRQTVTSSGGLMAIDRVGIVYKSLTWGTRAKYNFTNTTFSDSDAGLRGATDVRDLGATLFGSTSVTDTVHFKYYLGLYDGVQEAQEDNFRYAGRVQLNFFDPEPGYYNLTTYLGKKKTIGFGASYDAQQAVAKDLSDGSDVDYTFFSFDAFADYPIGPGYVTFEAGYEDLDLDGATQLDAKGDGSKVTNARQAQGNGFYAEAGYFVRNWQPWIEYEQWNSDGTNDKGSYDAWRFGLNYYIKGHNANVKAAYEIVNTDADIGSSSEDSVGSFLVGIYVTY
ncbi:MAG: hypothetical protein Kow0092_06800 [Deferrisomatales bacterium]